METVNEPNKKLRYTDPDLLVMIETAESQKVYSYHAAVLASQSTYIDTMLASVMREPGWKEAGFECVITFPDIEQATWEDMIKFLEPIEARRLTPEDAKKLAVFYDKYEFVHGHAYCDAILAEPFQMESALSDSQNMQLSLMWSSLLTTPTSP